jgi:hypothetical protein
MPQTVTIEVFAGSRRAESTFKNPDVRPVDAAYAPAAAPAAVPAEVKP